MRTVRNTLQIVILIIQEVALFRIFIVVNVECIPGFDIEIFLFPVQTFIYHKVQKDDITNDCCMTQKSQAGGKIIEQCDEAELAIRTLNIHHKQNAISFVQCSLVVAEVVSVSKIPAGCNLSISSV
jgi:hypothetical protein